MLTITRYRPNGQLLVNKVTRATTQSSPGCPLPSHPRPSRDPSGHVSVPLTSGFCAAFAIDFGSCNLRISWMSELCAPGSTPGGSLDSVHARTDGSDDRDFETSLTRLFICWSEMEQVFPTAGALQKELSATSAADGMSWKSQFYRGTLHTGREKPAMAFKARIFMCLASSIPAILKEGLLPREQPDSGGAHRPPCVETLRVRLAVAHPNSRAGTELWCSASPL